MLKFREWLEAVMKKIDPFSPTGKGARTFYISRLPHPNIAVLERAKAQISKGDVQGALEALWRALEHYTSQGTRGDQHPEYRLILQAYNFINKEKNPHRVHDYVQAVDLCIKQLKGELSHLDGA